MFRISEGAVSELVKERNFTYKVCELLEHNVLQARYLADQNIKFITVSIQYLEVHSKHTIKSYCQKKTLSGISLVFSVLFMVV